MADSLNTSIPTRSEHERVWLVRASGGQYVRHFRHAEIAAIGHLDKFDFAPARGPGNKTVVLSPKELREVFQKKYHTPKATATSHISQVQQFCSDIKLGDLLVTVDSRFVAVGRVVGHAYFDKTPIDLSNDVYKDDPLKYQLRRPIAWGPSLSRRELPLPMERVFRSHRTVFEITKFWDYIYHLLFPAFVYKDELHLTLQVRQDQSIRNRDVVNLLSILQEFEEYAARYSGNEAGDSLTVRAGFFSKGDIWPRLTAKEKKRVIYLLLVGFLLGGGEIGKFQVLGQNIGPFKFNGAISIIMEIVKGAEEITKRNSGAEAIENMKLKAPQIDTAPIEKIPSKPANRETIQIAKT